MQSPYFWIPWLISAGSLAWALLRDHKNDRANLTNRVHQLEVAQAVDRATTNGQLELIRQQLTTTTGAAQQASQAIKNLLDHEQ